MGVDKKTESRGRLARCPALVKPSLILVASLAVLVGAGTTGQVWAQSSRTGEALEVDTGAGDFDFASQKLRVNVWHDKDADDVYQRDEAVRIHFEANEDAYAVVYRIDAAGGVTVLWPRSRYDDGFVFGQHHYNLPAAGSKPLRVSDEEGVEYVEAIVSAYPFDLRNLEVDFHHEVEDASFGFYVAGDPFLALNEVNYAITGLEDPGDYVVTNYTSYYVHRPVDHPRYLCGQCHDDGEEYHPYEDTCVVEINYDYGWYNRWWVRFGYYPVYHYPAYYYVDPWSYSPWVNYWYTPWYHWPGYRVYDWPYSYHAWCYSPYWQGDVWDYKYGHRRYKPLSKKWVKGDVDRDGYYRRKSDMVRSAVPSKDVSDAMRTRTRVNKKTRDLAKGTTAGVQSTERTTYRNTKPTERTRVTFRDTQPTTTTTAPGLRIRDRSRTSGTRQPVDTKTRLRSGKERKPVTDRSRSSSRSLENRDTAQKKSSSPARRTLRSVEPRKSGSRIWTGGRKSPSTSSQVRPQKVKPSSKNPGSSSSSPSRRSSVKKSRSKEPSKSEPSRSVRPSSPKKSSKSKSVRQTRPSSSSKSRSPSISSTPRKSSGSSSAGSRPSRSAPSSRSSGSGSTGKSTSRVRGR